MIVLAKSKNITKSRIDYPDLWIKCHEYRVGPCGGECTRVAGLGLGLYGLRWGALALSGVIIAIAAAVVLQHENFGFSAGVAITFGYLGLNQIAYVIGIAFRLGVSEADLTGDEPDEHPGDNRQEKVEDEHKQHDRTPPWGHPPNH